MLWTVQATCLTGGSACFLMIMVDLSPTACVGCPCCCIPGGASCQMSCRCWCRVAVFGSHGFVNNYLAFCFCFCRNGTKRCRLWEIQWGGAFKHREANYRTGEKVEAKATLSEGTESRFAAVILSRESVTDYWVICGCDVLFFSRVRSFVPNSPLMHFLGNSNRLVIFSRHNVKRNVFCFFI